MMSVLAACAGHPTLKEAKSKSVPSENIASTVKPGAAIDFAYELSKDIAPSEYGVLKLSFTDYYDGGTLKLSATPEPGLRLVSEVTEKEFSMASNDPHTWELDVTAAQDGVYYLNILAIVDLPDGRQTGRGFAARVEVGDISSGIARYSLDTVHVISADGKSIKMKADEVIK